LALWCQAVRAFSFTASMVPVFVGAAMAFSLGQEVVWTFLPLVIFCSLSFHAGTNLVSDYFDFVREVDKDYTYGSSRVIVEGLLTARQILVGGAVLFALGIAGGMVLVIFRGWPMLAIGVAGFLGGIFYTANPVGYKYIALGDIMVFLLMGPLMVIGSYFALTGSYDSAVRWVSLPVGLLVAAILYGNNLRDISHDKAARIRTVENMLGYGRAKLGYYGLIAGTYGVVVVMVLADLLSMWSLLVLLSFPLAMGCVSMVRACDGKDPAGIAGIDVATAQLHLAFGVLLCISIVLGVLI
jgi:1,4-dihydroxy-2-naphthoate octaprenyltransferase